MVNFYVGSETSLRSMHKRKLGKAVSLYVERVFVNQFAAVNRFPVLLKHSFRTETSICTPEAGLVKIAKHKCYVIERMRKQQQL